MSGGFGRRGLNSAGVGASAVKPANFGSTRAQVAPASVEEGPSPQMRAFLAAERARRAEQPEPSLSEVAMATPHGGGAAYIRTNRPDRSMILAYVLWYFGCAIAAHRFYLGATQSALIMLGLFVGGLFVMFLFPPLGLVLLGAWGLWSLADVALIPGLMRRYRESGDVAEAFA